MTSTANNQPPDRPNRRRSPASRGDASLRTYPVRALLAAPASARPVRFADSDALRSAESDALLGPLGDASLRTCPVGALHAAPVWAAPILLHLAAMLLNAMMERARSTAERQTINQNDAADPAPQIRPATEKIKSHAERSNPKPAGA